MEKNKITVLRIFSRTQSSASVWAEQHNRYRESPDKEVEISKQKALKRTPLESKSKQTQINFCLPLSSRLPASLLLPQIHARCLMRTRGLRTNLQANPYVKE
ncbi:hypothetical protein CEXT_125571 [Caerostris extrusa]|uniref:Uncharacterized protein n=1 Tax=Caerostris extrusa TaxID=172846 RepID=A0AAV4NWL6_CAEEX|nr:hypothetical protein CEXT_125571 [Caerostris extrusa]